MDAPEIASRLGRLEATAERAEQDRIRDSEVRGRVLDHVVLTEAHTKQILDRLDKFDARLAHVEGVVREHGGKFAKAALVLTIGIGLVGAVWAIVLPKIKALLGIPIG